MSEEIVTRILKSKKKVLFESDTPGRDLVTKDIGYPEEDLVDKKLESEVKGQKDLEESRDYDAEVGDTFVVGGILWRIEAIGGDYAIASRRNPNEYCFIRGVYGKQEDVKILSRSKLAVPLCRELYKKSKDIIVEKGLTREVIYDTFVLDEGKIPEESYSCVCGGREFVKEGKRLVCNSCGREGIKKLKEDSKKPSSGAVIRRALVLWNEGKYEKAMNLCNNYGVSDREFIDALVKSFRESDEVKGEEVEDSNLNNLSKLEEDVIDGDSKDFDSRSVKSGDSVRFTRKGMTDVPVVGKRFKVGWLTGKCTSLTAKEAVMLVEDEELEVVAPAEKSNLEKSIIYAMQTPVSTAKRPNIDDAITECDDTLKKDILGESILKSMKNSSIKEAIKTLDSFEVKATSGQRYRVAYRSDHTTDIQGIRPYDDADYYWAKSDDSEDTYNIYYKGKRVKSIRTHSSSPSLEVVKELDSLNKNIKSRMVHN